MPQKNPGGTLSLYLEVHHSGITGERIATLRHTAFQGSLLTDCGLRTDALQKVFGLITLRSALQVVVCTRCLDILTRRATRLELVDESGVWIETPDGNTGVNYA